MRKSISIILSILVLAGAAYATMQIMGREKKQRPQPPKVVQAVFTEEVQNGSIPLIISESGRLTSKNRLDVYSEVQGVMESTGKEFKPGTTYSKGEVMVRIRNRDYYANLQAQKSVLQNLITSIMPDLRLDYPDSYAKWDKYLKDFNVEKPLKPLPEVSSEKEKYFITGKNIYTTYYNTRNLEIVFQKYTLRAPFNGILTEAVVNPGTVVRPGQKLGEFIDPTVYELEVAISKTFIPVLEIGKKVGMIDPQDPTQKWAGIVTRINGRVNSATQTVQVFIEVRANNLREGMYLNAQIEGTPNENAYEVSRQLLVNETQVYIVSDSSLQLVPIEVVHKTDKTAIIKGLDNGMLIMTKSVPGAYSGMPVVINATEN